MYTVYYFRSYKVSDRDTKIRRYMTCLLLLITALLDSFADWYFPIELFAKNRPPLIFPQLENIPDLNLFLHDKFPSNSFPKNDFIWLPLESQSYERFFCTTRESLVPVRESLVCESIMCTMRCCVTYGTKILMYHIPISQLSKESHGYHKRVTATI